MNMKILRNIKFLSFCFLITLFLGSISFDRSFVGLSFKGFRLGELIMAMMFVSSLGICLLNKKLISRLRLEDFTPTINLFRLILISFVISIVYFKTSFFSTYTYKTSSYIWIASSFFIFYFLSPYLQEYKKYVRFLSLCLLILPVIHYFFSTGYYPNFIMDIFIKYSDKFNFTKASDIMISLIICNLLYRLTEKNKDYSLFYFGFSIPLLLPLLLEMSRGSFIAALAFFIFILIYDAKYLLKNKRSLIIFILISFSVFIFSTYRIGGVNFDFSQEENVIIDTSISGNIAKIAKKNETRKAFFSFYIEDGRIVSHDNTTNWRLDIWQDVVDDLDSKDSIFKGYGYNEIIPVMTDPSAPGRLGRDGLNEHVHSYIFNILARGGILQLIIFIAFHFSFLLIWYKKFNNFQILLFMVPIFINSITDMNMEGVQFPFLYYSFLAIFFNLSEYEKNKSYF